MQTTTRVLATALAPTLLLALLAAGCGSSDDTTSTSKGGTTDAGSDAILGFDVSGNDVGGSDSGGGGGTDETDATVEDTAPNGLCEFPANPAKGEAGAPCSDNSECDSSFCATTTDGGRCTLTCTDCCPTGWGCQQAPGKDAVYVCLPRLEALCLPCVADDECESRNKGALCLSYEAGTAHFCGGGCNSDGDCPSGYECKDSKGTAGQAKQCVRKSGLCECGKSAIAQGMPSLCIVSNADGTCEGARVCSAEGLSACDAQTPTAESCNGKDDDCDGQTDEDVGAKACEITNEFGTCKGTSTCEAGAAPCTAQTPAAEACNGKDDDCDGKTDEGCDDDNDGYCADGIAITDLPEACNQPGGCGDATMPTWCSKGIHDCDDGDKAVFPGAAEACGNNKDDDCDGQTDLPGKAKDGSVVAPTGCKPFYADADKDGYGDATKSACLCVADLAFPLQDTKDCDDNDGNVKPGVQEVCGNGKDDDCDGDQNQKDAKGCTNFYADKDGDTYGAGDPQCLCAPKEDYKATAKGDCDDSKTAVSPAATESCNGKDDNCNGDTDEEGAQDCKTWYVDGDKDGYGDPAKSGCFCGATGLFATLQAGDCNDGNPQIHEGLTELCNDSIDNNCNGSTDEENAKNCTDWYLDSDKDGYGDTSNKKCLCDKGDVPGYTVSKGTDCDDSNSTISPEAKEICDGKDNDCDNSVDTGCDADGDGYCDGTKTTVGKPASCPKGGGDCNDDPTNGGKTIYPGATEICDGKDNNCSAGVDEGCDDDSDGYCDKNKTLVGSPAICPKGGGDCADSDKTINPGATEICNNKDDNCAGGVDEGCDDDKDGYCDKAMTVVGTPTVCSKGGGDCCDLDSDAYPGQTSWFTSANKCANFDYDCSNAAEKQFTVLAAAKHICEGFLCVNKAECIADPAGWQNAAPNCGASATWITDYQWNGSLTLPLVNTCKTSVTSQKTQGCH